MQILITWQFWTGLAILSSWICSISWIIAEDLYSEGIDTLAFFGSIASLIAVVVLMLLGTHVSLGW